MIHTSIHIHEIDLFNLDKNQGFVWKMQSNQAIRITPLQLLVGITLSPECFCLLNLEVAQNSSLHN